jgi:hypothetical protein
MATQRAVSETFVMGDGMRWKVKTSNGRRQMNTVESKTVKPKDVATGVE